MNNWKFYFGVFKNFFKKNHLKAFLRFIGISVFTFVVIFSFLYGSVYFEILSFRFYKVLGFDMDTVLSNHLNVLNKDGLLEVNKAEPEQNIAMADFDMQISPPDNRMIIPKVFKNMPIIDISSDNLVNSDTQAFQNDILKGLETGVVHYPMTALPGQKGNFVLTGHSSYYSWKPGEFKDAFASMHNVEIGDKITVYYNQQKYIYEVIEKKVVAPDDVSVLNQPEDDYLLTTITCTPIGTNTNRLIHVARLLYSF